MTTSQYAKLVVDKSPNLESRGNLILYTEYADNFSRKQVTTIKKPISYKEKVKREREKGKKNFM